MAKQKPQEELYDLENDPFELNNLAEETRYQDSLKMFRIALENWMTETRDLGGVNEQDLIAKWHKVEEE